MFFYLLQRSDQYKIISVILMPTINETKKTIEPNKIYSILVSPYEYQTRNFSYHRRAY
jgi:hypothetical protein